MGSTLTQIRERLLSERGDPAGVLHSEAEYNRVILESVADAPRDLWPTKDDESTATATGTERYTPNIADLLAPGDILNIYVRQAKTGETGYQDWQPVAWRAYDDGGTIKIGYRLPWATGHTIRISYRYQATTPTASAETELSLEWLVADCMVRLLRRLPPDLAADAVKALLDLWREARQAAYLRNRKGRPPRIAWTAYWPLRD